jgi:hypothetical protein
MGLRRLKNSTAIPVWILRTAQLAAKPLENIQSFASGYSTILKYDINQFYSDTVLRRLEASAGNMQQGGLER